MNSRARALGGRIGKTSNLRDRLQHVSPTPQTIYIQIPIFVAISVFTSHIIFAFLTERLPATKLAFLRLLIGHVIDTTEVQRTEAASNHHIEPSTQDNISSSVVSQLRNDYSSLPSNTSRPCLSCTQGHQSSPVDVQKFANPAPLGLCAFALVCFISSCISLNVGDIQAAGVSVSLALNYGGIAQVLAGMWYVSIHPTYQYPLEILSRFVCIPC